MARGKGEGSIIRVPADRKQPLKFWQAAIELPPRNGNRRRLTKRSKDKSAVLAWKAEKEEQLRRTGDLETTSWTLEAWMTYWLDKIMVRKLRPRPLRDYRYLTETKILPVIGHKKLEKLTPSDVRAVHDAIFDEGLASSTALKAHRVLSGALKQAHREGKVPRNVATLVDAPVKNATNLRALTLDEGLQVLDSVKNDPLGSLWAAFLLTGAREGELLGLGPDRIREVVYRGRRDRVLEFSWQLQRFTWQHGCEVVGKNDKGKPIYYCGRKRGTDCPARIVKIPANHEAINLVGGLWIARPKTAAGWRVIPLVEPLDSLIARHMEQTAEDPNPHGLIWRHADGSPIDPALCNRMWHAVLDRAGVPQVRLHDARHTTVDLLLLAGVPIELIKDIVGHSSWLQTAAYKTRAVTVRHAAAMRSLSDLFSARRLELESGLESAS